jgi:hypothetical protein
MNKIELAVIFLPLILTFFYILTFFILQQIYSERYLGNLIYSFIFNFIANICLIYKFSYIFGNHQIFYIVVVYLCGGYIFMNLIQIPISSLQAKILKMIYSDLNLTEKSILTKYNSSNVFEERIKTFLSNKTIIIKKSLIILQNKKILLFYLFFKLLKKIYNIKLS